jgi:HSP20 family protein
MIVVKNKRTPQACYDSRLNNQHAFHPMLMNDLHRFFGSDEQSETPKVNISEDDQSFSIHLAVPGVKKEDLKINVERDLLTISSEVKKDSEENQPRFLRKEFSYAGFKRSFKLPESADVSGIKASYSEGILMVVLPKKAASKENDAKTIAIS